MTDLKAKIAAIREALPGVTPGPWSVEHPMNDIDFVVADMGKNTPWRDIAQIGLESADEYGTPPEEARANAQYIAHLDPQTVAAILERYERMEAYAREATTAITGLTVGGSEYFGKRIGEMYTADLPYCVKKIREWREAEHDRLVGATKRVKELEASLAEAMEALEPFARIANEYDTRFTDDAEPRFRIGTQPGDFRRARDVYSKLESR